MDLNKKETKLLHKVDAGWTSLEMDKEGKTLFILNGKNMQKMNLASDDLKPIKYLAQVKLDLSAEREYMFDHVYKQQQKRFYNTNMHGVNWDAMTAAYRKFLDSRSFLSYPRHEYFRRTLCNLLGRDVENGEIPECEIRYFLF